MSFSGSTIYLCFVNHAICETFKDGFSTDTTAEYTVVDTIIAGGVGEFYMTVPAIRCIDHVYKK